MDSFFYYLSCNCTVCTDLLKDVKLIHYVEPGYFFLFNKNIVGLSFHICENRWSRKLIYISCCCFLNEFSSSNYHQSLFNSYYFISWGGGIRSICFFLKNCAARWEWDSGGHRWHTYVKLLTILHAVLVKVNFLIQQVW